ncbi:hypothetical protein BABINDRAFT_160539 [Babjeviella inositovora NRRL Y-12698]|uniref:AN1-type domain-containing protein n=1 Tax=Babjeviella inositovora NRRL Y-12698 TaxID=984486 RepID=A0A1E3QTX6_9ASCO|nr:uncharacterized protein BABINDRAFT_160539 [Babjeviella inositovora NRRL Y-12698]ODQ81138.1 hypothetical protein BABINDRAFT_160539 [Babjeviella inositovora NRRL Y-12698]
MKIFVKSSSGSPDSLFSITIPDNSSVMDLKTSVIIAAPIAVLPSGAKPSLFKLVFNGKVLDILSQKLETLDIVDHSTIILVHNNHSLALQLFNPLNSPIIKKVELCLARTDSATLSNTLTPTTSPTAAAASVTKPGIKRKTFSKKTCHFLQCHQPQAKFIGDCTYCNHKYCSKHRLVEDHSCSELRHCQEEYRAKNANKLMNEQTFASKV